MGDTACPRRCAAEGRGRRRRHDSIGPLRSIWRARVLYGDQSAGDGPADRSQANPLRTKAFGVAAGPLLPSRVTVAPALEHRDDVRRRVVLRLQYLAVVSNQR